MIEYAHDQQKRQNLICFIKSAQKILIEEGLKNVSIRKIAAVSGFHSSTIYVYFNDLDELLMLASIKRFQKYNEVLEKQSKKHADAYDNFFAIWQYFAEASFQYPCNFYNFFFGKYSDNLTKFLNIYYDLFPEEKSILSEELEAMYLGKNYSERCMRILSPLIGDSKTCVTEENASLINEITICISMDFLHKKCTDQTLDSALLEEKMMEMLHFLVDKK